MLLVSADRYNKHALLAYKVFARLKITNPDLLLVVTNNVDFVKDNIIAFNFLSSSDLNILYKNAYALLYPSISEGFGYPPVEAMRYAVPVLSSNVCSMPEILEDSAIYFSPFYENDLYAKIIFLLENRNEYVERSIKQFEKVSKKQGDDFLKLISKINISK